MTKRWLGWVALPLWLVVSVAGAGELLVAKPEDVGMSAVRLAKVSAAMDDMVKEKKLGGLIMPRYPVIVDSVGKSATITSGELKK